MREDFASGFRDEHHILDAHSSLLRKVDPRLHCDDAAWFEHKLSAYTWNVVQRYEVALTLAVREVRTDGTGALAPPEIGQGAGGGGSSASAGSSAATSIALKSAPRR